MPRKPGTEAQTPTTLLRPEHRVGDGDASVLRTDRVHRVQATAAARSER